MSMWTEGNEPPADQTAGKNGMPRMSIWTRFTRWLFLRDEIDALRAELIDVAARVARIEAMLAGDEPPVARPAAPEPRGPGWEIL